MKIHKLFPPRWLENRLWMRCISPIQHVYSVYYVYIHSYTYWMYTHICSNCQVRWFWSFFEHWTSFFHTNASRILTFLPLFCLRRRSRRCVSHLDLPTLSRRKTSQLKKKDEKRRAGSPENGEDSDFNLEKDHLKSHENSASSRFFSVSRRCIVLIIRLLSWLGGGDGKECSVLLFCWKKRNLTWEKVNF